MTRAGYQRILLKLSGEALMGGLKYGIHPDRLAAIAQEIQRVVSGGTEIAIDIEIARNTARAGALLPSSTLISASPLPSAMAAGPRAYWAEMPDVAGSSETSPRAGVGDGVALAEGVAAVPSPPSGACTMRTSLGGVLR